METEKLKSYMNDIVNCYELLAGARFVLTSQYVVMTEDAVEKLESDLLEYHSIMVDLFKGITETELLEGLLGGSYKKALGDAILEEYQLFMGSQ